MPQKSPLGDLGVKKLICQGRNDGRFIQEEEK